LIDFIIVVLHHLKKIPNTKKHGEMVNLYIFGIYLIVVLFFKNKLKKQNVCCLARTKA